jgi:hypothetical protein
MFHPLLLRLLRQDLRVLVQYLKLEAAAVVVPMHPVSLLRLDEHWEEVVVAETALLRGLLLAALVPLDDQAITALPMLALLVCKPWSNEEVTIRMVVVATAVEEEEEERSSSPQLVHRFYFLPTPTTVNKYHTIFSTATLECNATDDTAKKLQLLHCLFFFKIKMCSITIEKTIAVLASRQTVCIRLCVDRLPFAAPQYPLCWKEIHNRTYPRRLSFFGLLALLPLV